MTWNPPIRFQFVAVPVLCAVQTKSRPTTLVEFFGPDFTIGATPRIVLPNDTGAAATLTVGGKRGVA